MRYIILGLMVLFFIGCGGSSTVNDSPASSETPTSPVTQEKEKTPPSIPNI